jgi:hypothetical protein
MWLKSLKLVLNRFVSENDKGRGEVAHVKVPIRFDNFVRLLCQFRAAICLLRPNRPLLIDLKSHHFSYNIDIIIYKSFWFSFKFKKK